MPGVWHYSEARRLSGIESVIWLLLHLAALALVFWLLGCAACSDGAHPDWEWMHSELGNQ
jgi:hypothetical protein